jgi:two-component sensor histidine kinase
VLFGCRHGLAPFLGGATPYGGAGKRRPWPRCDVVANAAPATVARDARLASRQVRKLIVVSLTKSSGDVTPSAGDADLELRVTMLRIGPWLGWASMVAVLAGLAVASHRDALLVLALAAAALNAAAMRLPWRDWLLRTPGRLLLDLWSGALIAFVALLVVFGGNDFSLLLFLTVPYIALVQIGRRRAIWLGLSGATCTLVAVLAGLPTGITVMRSALLAAVVTVALVLASALRRESAAHLTTLERAELERARVAEANHRIKNNLQTVADLLLLDRPAGQAGRAFDETVGRIHSIASLHRLLADSDDESVDSTALLASIARTAPVPVDVEAGHLLFDSSTAQLIGLVANELITNASRHGAEPINVSLGGTQQLVLRVDDGGRLANASAGLGLELVRQIVERGLGGQFRLAGRPGGGTRAEVVFPRESASEF